MSKNLTKSPKVSPATDPVLPGAVTDALASPASLPDIYQKTIALSLDRSKFGNRRKVSMVGVEVDADKNMLSLTKRLLNSPELKAIATLDSEAAQYLTQMAVPSFFKPGIYLVPLPLVEKVEAKLVELRDKRTILLDALVAAYPGQIDNMQAILRDMFNAADYPSVEEFRRQFAFSWRYLNLGAPGQLESVNAKLYAEQRKQIEATVQDAAQEIRVMLRATMQELINHMVDRLTPGPDGKPKVFRESMITNFNAFVDNFSMRNITDDAALQALVTQAKAVVGGAIVGGADAATLRSNTAVRDHVVHGLEQIKATLDTMVTVKGRMIQFDDDDDAPAFGVKTTGQKAWATRKARAAGTAAVA